MRIAMLALPAGLLLCAAPPAGAGAGTYEAPRDVRKTAGAKFTAGPKASRAGEKVKITFTVSAATDVEVAVLDAKGRVVRHLAAGLPGENAPAPLRKNSLRQEIAWDRRDDLGKPAAGGPFKVRVRIGSAPRLDRIVGWDGATLGAAPMGMAVGTGGELYVLDSEGTWGRAGLRVFGPDGAYRRTIMPYAASTPKGRTAAMGHLEVDGQRLPIIYNGNAPTLVPLTDGMKNQTMAWHPKGYLLAASAVGTINAHGLPRHLLAFHPRGGAPEGVGFAGPEIRRPRGFMGGSGEGFSRYFDHLAVSPEGEWIYFVPCKMSDRKPRHAVFRLKWSDQKLGAAFLGKDGEAGGDDAHLNDPQGVACDAKGSVYVCDRGNGRVMVFASDGKLLGKFAVEVPEQIAVHPKSGEIYVLSRGRSPKRRDRWDSKTALRRFSPWGGGAPRELARLEGKNITLMALDPESSPPKIWCAFYTGWGRPQQITPVTGKGGRLVPGEPITSTRGLAFPLFITADPARGRVLIREKAGGKKGMRALDLATGKISRLPVSGSDLTIDRQGNLHVMDGYMTSSMSRYTPEGEPLPFPAAGSHKLKIGFYRAYGPEMGMRGIHVTPAGDIYILRTNNYGYGGVLENNGVEGCVDVWGPDGKIKKRGIVNGLGRGDCGIAVDGAGNIYVGINVKKKPMPACLEGKVPPKGWLWWRRGKREAPWYYAYHYAYLFHLGSLFKFGPEGGRLYGNGGKPRALKGKPEPNPSPLLKVENAPAGAASFRSGYLVKEVRVAGAKWFYPGCSVIPASDVGWGDPSCCCVTSHLAVDLYGRAYMPNAFLFSVEMLDSAGNLITRIGRYGNADSAGPESKVPKPEIAFANPLHVSEAGGRLYVSDPVNRRVTVVRLEHAAEAVCAVP